MVAIRGGKDYEKKLAQIVKLMKRPGLLRVGFLENAKYPNGTSVALVAAIQNYGAPRARIPPRPFFSNMIARKGPEWPGAIGGLLVANGYDASLTLRQTGEAVAGQLRQSLIDTNDPPLAASTIRRKGFDKPLVDTGHMLNSIDFEVAE